MKKLKLVLEWENKVSFELTAKFNDGENIQIIKVEENGNLGILWSNIANVCKDYFATELSKIGTTMKEV